MFVKSNVSLGANRNPPLRWDKDKFLKTVTIVCLIAFFSTLASWYISKKTLEKENWKMFNDEVNIVESWITNRLEIYKTIGYGFQALIQGNEKITKEEWQKYAETLLIPQRFPGVTSIGFSQKKDDGFYLTFVYPSEREMIIGTNLADYPERLEAIKKAIETGQSAFTKRVFLLADKKPGFVMFIPVRSQKTEEVIGVIGITFRSQEVFKDLFDAKDIFPYLDFELYKGKIMEEDYILYDHDYAVYIPKENLSKRLETKRTILIDSEVFTLLVKGKPSYQPRIIENNLPNFVLGFGLILTFGIYFYFLFEYRKIKNSQTP